MHFSSEFYFQIKRNQLVTIIIVTANILKCLLYTHSAYINCFNSNNSIRKLLSNEVNHLTSLDFILHWHLTNYLKLVIKGMTNLKLDLGFPIVKWACQPSYVYRDNGEWQGHWEELGASQKCGTRSVNSVALGY